MKNINKLLSLFILLCSISVNAESNHEDKFQRGDIVYYANTTVGYNASPVKSIVVALRSSKHYVLERDEVSNGHQYITSANKAYIYHSDKCTNATDDGSKVCTNGKAISLSHAKDVDVIGISNDGLRLLVDFGGLYRVLSTKNFISTMDEESEL